MTDQNNKNVPAATDLKSMYQPLGIKALQAATMMLKRKPVTKPA